METLIKKLNAETIFSQDFRKETLKALHDRRLELSDAMEWADSLEDSKAYEFEAALIDSVFAAFYQQQGVYASDYYGFLNKTL